MSDLREQLIKHLSPLSFYSAYSDEALADLVDEVIRQMESAWLQGCRAGEDITMSCGYSFERAHEQSFPDQGPLRERRGYPLDLAPKDWNP